MSKIIKSILLTVLTLSGIPHSYGQELSKEQIQLIANNLLISKAYHTGIKKILPPVNDVQVVLLDLPYREFPGIIIIHRDKETKSWKRVFECLSPGIQDKSSGLLDWHTKGEGVDFMIGDVKTYDFQDKKVRAVIETTLKKDGPVVIPYQNFIHMNTSGDSNPEGFMPYTIDKTQYFDFANILFDNRYKNYPAGNCTMFDSPAITDCAFKFENNLYTITATTNTNQIWTYTFEAVDTQNRYLLHKKITVKKMQ